MGLRPLEPVDVRPLLPGLHAELVSLLEGLAPADWNRPTLAGLWTVRNAEWVRAAQRPSPRVIVDLLKTTGSAAADAPPPIVFESDTDLSHVFLTAWAVMA